MKIAWKVVALNKIIQKHIIWTRMGRCIEEGETKKKVQKRIIMIRIKKKIKTRSNKKKNSIWTNLKKFKI